MYCFSVVFFVNEIFLYVWGKKTRRKCRIVLCVNYSSTLVNN